MAIHKNLSIGNGIHIPYAWSYADASARTGASGFATADIGKFARQTDNDTIWMLTAITPTWKAVSVDVGTGAVTDGYILVADGSDYNGVALSGDATITNAGVITVADVTVGSDAAGDIHYKSSATVTARLAKGTANQVLAMNSGATAPEWQTLSSLRYISFYLPSSAVVATGQAYILMDFAGDVTDANAYAVTAPTGSDLNIDVNINGTSIFSTTLEIDAGANADDGNKVIDTANDDFAIGDRISIDIDAIGSTVAGADIMVTLELTPS
jgi:hypothetical protein